MKRPRPFILGLTGSIGMGKSTTADFFREEGLPVWDADAAVHRLYGPGGAAVEPLGTLVPEAITGGAVSRTALSAALRLDPALIERIEAIVHPLVAEDRAEFLAARTEDIVVLDVPLLYETGGDAACDAVVVVTAPPEVQRERVLARADMDPARFEALLGRQVPDAEKRRRADYVIDTSRGLEAARRQVQDVIRSIRAGHNA